MILWESQRPGLMPCAWRARVCAVTPNKRRSSQVPGHVLGPAVAIGGLSLVLVVGLAALGFLTRINAGIAQFVSRNGAEKFPRHLPDWSVWLATVVFSCGLAIAILSTPGQGRRSILWITSVVLIAAWAPVLSLAAHAPDISAPWIATFWSGACAMAYAGNHRMAGDETPPSRP